MIYEVLINNLLLDNRPLYSMRPRQRSCESVEPVVMVGDPASLRLSGRFENAPLESAYQRYSHRQRQKSLIVVNCVDIVLKIITILLTVFDSHNDESSSPQSIDCSDPTLIDPAQCYPNGSLSANSHQIKMSTSSNLIEPVIWTSCLIVANVILCLLAFFWRGFANNYLHWAAIATWILMNLQGNFNSFCFFLYSFSNYYLLALATRLGSFFNRYKL